MRPSLLSLGPMLFVVLAFCPHPTSTFPVFSRLESRLLQRNSQATRPAVSVRPEVMENIAELSGINARGAAHIKTEAKFFIFTDGVSVRLKSVAGSGRVDLKSRKLESPVSAPGTGHFRNVGFVSGQEIAAYQIAKMFIKKYPRLYSPRYEGKLTEVTIEDLHQKSFSVTFFAEQTEPNPDDDCNKATALQVNLASGSVIEELRCGTSIKS